MDRLHKADMFYVCLFIFYMSVSTTSTFLHLVNKITCHIFIIIISSSSGSGGSSCISNSSRMLINVIRYVFLVNLYIFWYLFTIG